MLVSRRVPPLKMNIDHLKMEGLEDDFSFGVANPTWQVQGVQVLVRSLVI